MTKEELIACCTKSGARRLSAVIEHYKQKEADAIDAKGPAAQIEYLLECGLRLDELERIVPDRVD